MARVQDERDPVVDRLIGMGAEAIPFLIGKLMDPTRHQGACCLLRIFSVGDAAFYALIDLMTCKPGVPGAAWEDWFGPPDPVSGALLQFEKYVKKHGRRAVQSRWRALWEKNKDRIVWSEASRCFQLSGQEPHP